jgi:hypothetical protein
MAIALRLVSIPPAAKLLAIYIGDYYGAGPSDPVEGHSFNIEDAAKFCCVDSHEIDGLLKRIPDLVAIPMGEKSRKVWLSGRFQK